MKAAEDAASKEKDSAAPVVIDTPDAATEALIQLEENAQLTAAQREELKAVAKLTRETIGFTSMKRVGTAKQPHAPIVYLYDLVI